MFDNQHLQTTDTIIAGQHSGKPVSITPRAELIYNEMVSLASAGNHWALLAVNGINDLAAGRLHQSNIFINPSQVCRGGHEEFFVILPGCKATVEKLPSDTFKIVHFEADLNYSELQETQSKPGLYRAELKSEGWGADFVRGAQIEPVKNRLIAISDSGHGSPVVAAKKSAPRVTEAPFSGGGITVNDDGFDMHYTPGQKRIGGLKNYKKAIKPLDNSELNESALLLAKTMFDAKDVQGVGWISEFGGSGVLTQALKILADQNIKLGKHKVFLYRPTTSPNEAIKAAHAVGLKIDRKFTKTNSMDYIGNRDQLEMIGQRVKNERGDKGDYSLAKAGVDILAHGKSVQAGGLTAGAILGAAGITLAAPAAAVAFLGIFAKTAAMGATTIGIGKLGGTLTEAYLPSMHDSIKSKF